MPPSNILVTVQDDRPVPKVIDFGVAKTTQTRLTDKTLFTRFHQLIGTPAYMSPEQTGLGSLDVDTRSDVYALGVLLYELLTGRPPFETERLLAAGFEAMMRTIREEEPPKPSTRLSTLDDAERNAVADRRQAKPDKLDRGDWLGAALWFSDALRLTGPNATAEAANRLRLGVILAYAPRLVRLWSHAGPVNRASFSPDGQWVLTAAQDGMARLWDLANDQPVGAALRHAASVQDAEFSRDGRYVVTTCEDSTARVWEAASGKVVSPPLVHPLPLFRAWFSRDGRHVFTASSRDAYSFSWSDAGELEFKMRSEQSEIRVWETASGEPLTPVLGGGLGDPFPSGRECLVPHARAVLARGGAAPQLWPLRPDQRPIEELSRHVQLLAARELDAWGSLAPLPPARLTNLWHTVQSALPVVSSVGTNQVALWHLHEAAQSEAEGQWSSAEFHFSRLPGTPLDGPQIRQRLARARTQAAIELLKKNP